MKTRILITHISQTLNYGSAMMALNLISRMKPLLPDTEIYCECDDYNLDRLKAGTGVHDLKKFDALFNTKLTPITKVKRYIFGSDESIKKITDNFDILIVLGGDDLSETYKKGALLKGSVYKSINKKCKVILAGQSFGPFFGSTRTMVKNFYKDISIITRDDNSYEFSKSLGIKKLVKSRDLAMMTLPNQKEFGKILENYPDLHPDKYITMVPSGLWHKYTEDKEGYIKTWKKLILNLTKRFPDFKFVILGHVLAPAKSDDRFVIKEIEKSMDQKEKENLIFITDAIQPAEARQVLGGSFMVITGRMHAAVSTFFMRKPAISLAYSEKYAGVIGRGLALPDLIVESRNQTWGDQSPLLEEVDKKITYVEENYDQLTTKIDSKMEECTALVEDQINFIVKEILEFQKLPA
ncbi:polysaccharide pyruvyl transferase family protein [Echinicola rosea]|uniref:Polysaccharide pyruvyl transferase domain-containing protein n=1 Tax=Echinicola rosea TaxID=1807691 RepID=A0ABQ1V9Q0_9BACT|nr:polysaccharide pyruvyl transferase family protein [Echinicola rosea]GGF44816.1 hypothetical protein GCM10011339_36670 [Echinicola rosea]